MSNEIEIAAIGLSEDEFTEVVLMTERKGKTSQMQPDAKPDKPDPKPPTPEPGGPPIKPQGDIDNPGKGEPPPPPPAGGGG